MHIGKKIKQLREAQNLTLVELSKKSDVQVATLSRVENGKMRGTVDSHLNIAKALNVSISELYQAVMRDEETKAKSKKSTVTTTNDKVSYQMLSEDVQSKKLLPLLIKLEPNSQTKSEKNIIGSEKFIFVLEGSVEVNFAREKTYLSKDQAIHFISDVEHFIKNSKTKPAKIITILTPPNF